VTTEVAGIAEEGGERMIRLFSSRRLGDHTMAHFIGFTVGMPGGMIAPGGGLSGPPGRGPPSPPGGPPGPPGGPPHRRNSSNDVSWLAVQRPFAGGPISWRDPRTRECVGRREVRRPQRRRAGSVRARRSWSGTGGQKPVSFRASRPHSINHRKLNLSSEA